MLVTTTPIVLVRLVASERATALARKPDLAAICRILSDVSSLTSGLPRSARETVEWDTPAMRAMSFIEVGRSSVVLNTCACRLYRVKTYPVKRNFGHCRSLMR